MMRLKSVFFIVFVLIAPGFALAHPGRVNVNGGHRDMATGEYHRHRPSGQEGSAYKDAVIQVDVLRVIDGDTFVARFPNGTIEKVRIKGIDTPERGEKGFTEATDLLKGRIGNKKIEIEVGVYKKRGNYLRGYYGRVLADILGPVMRH